MRVRLASVLVLVLVGLSAPAGAAVHTGSTPEDVAALAAHLLADPALAPARGKSALVRVDVTDGPDTWLRLDAGGVTPGSPAPGARAYVLSLSTDALLAARNAEDPARVLRCLARDGFVTLASPYAEEQLALRAMRARAAEGIECAGAPRPPRVADAYGAPLGWRDADAGRWLARPGAGVSRLAPDEVAALAREASVDLADPWRAPLALRSQIARAAEGLCLEACASGALIPAGDRRAALAADPRARGAGP